MNDAQRLIEMAKNSTNPNTILVELFRVLTSKVDELAKKFDERIKADPTAEELAMKLAARLVDIHKGEDGRTPTTDELVELIRPLIPDVKDGHTPTNEEIIALIKPLIPQIKDGITPTTEQLLALIKPLIPAAIPGRDGSPDSPADIVTKLESLNGDDRLGIYAIKGLTEMVESLLPRKSGAIFGPGKTKIVRIDLSSQLNGVTKTFFLGTHYGIVDVNSSSAPFGAFREGTDYNESGKNIVFTSNVDAAVSLATGQSLIVKVLR